jgi:8-oxo-dGTP diphosphatase
MVGYTKGTTPGGEARKMQEAFARAAAAIQAWPDPAEAFRAASELRILARQLEGEAGGLRASIAAMWVDRYGLSIGQAAKYLGTSRSRAAELVTIGRRKGNPVSDPGTEPQQPAIALAIVAGPDGILLERRNDGIPPWTFPGGEVLEGESPADAIIRRVPQETGLQVRYVRYLGQRIHPRTARLMNYLAAEVTGGELALGDPGDLAEVKWASIPETLGLMPDIFPSVRAYLDGLET